MLLLLLLLELVPGSPPVPAVVVAAEPVVALAPPVEPLLMVAPPAPVLLALEPDGASVPPHAARSSAGTTQSPRIDRRRLALFMITLSPIHPAPSKPIDRSFRQSTTIVRAPGPTGTLIQVERVSGSVNQPEAAASSAAREAATGAVAPSIFTATAAESERTRT